MPLITQLSPSRRATVVRSRRRAGGITSALIGASKPEQILDCAGAIGNLEFSAEDLAEIDRISEEKDVNLWAKSSETD